MSAAAAKPEPESRPPARIEPSADDVATEFTASEPAAEEGAPAWMMTFGDMMSLLLTFFILLFSMSEIEVDKFRAAAASLAEGLGAPVTQVAPMPAPGDGTSQDSAAATPGQPDAADAELDAIASQLEEFVQDNRLEETVIVARESHGVYLRIQDVALFPPGAATIVDESEWVIAQLAEVTKMIAAPVVVSGHTDTIPISVGAFRSNWELSAVRAAGVARGLVELGQDPQLVTVEAFGEYRPIDTNSTPEGRAKNRRVELFYSRQNVEESLDAQAAADSARAAADTTAQ